MTQTQVMEHTTSKRLGNKLALRHGHAKVGKVTVEWHTWQRMKMRCYNPKTRRYERYGGRGITVCERWLHSFDNFIADMGLRPSSDHSIERIDNNGNYSPNNCRWATRIEQGRNKRNNRIITLGSESLTVADWERKRGWPIGLIKNRLRLGWEPERAITTKLIRRPRKKMMK